MTDRQVLLSARGLTKRFGGLAAVNDVSLELWLGHIHAVIGPNGAGKSTLTNLLSGDLPPSAGQVQLGSTDVTGWAPERISRQGLGRSYQKTNIFLPLTVHENVRLAAQSRDAQQPWNPLRWWQDTRANTIKNRATSARLESAIELSGLKDRRTAIAGAQIVSQVVEPGNDATQHVGPVRDEIVDQRFGKTGQAHAVVE